MNLYKEQERKQNSWDLPNSWLHDPNTRSGRSYLGRLKLLLELAGDLAGKQVLDAGCGDGILSAKCALKGGTVTGVDINPRALAFAKIFSPPSVTYQQSSIHKLNFPNEFFDITFCIETFEHIPPSQEREVVEELHRTLKPGGRLIISVPSSSTPLRSRPRHYRHFNSSLLKVIFSDFFLIDKMYGQESSAFFVKIISSFCENKYWKIYPLTRFVNNYLFTRYWNLSPINKSFHIIATLRKKYEK